MMSRTSLGLLRLLSVGVALLGPSFMAFQLVSAAGNPAAQLRGGIVSETLLLAQNASPADANTVADAPPVTAILYTNGAAKVRWNDRVFTVDDGSYAYVGGERVDVAPGSMGMLQLSDGSSVFACAGSSVAIAPADDGGYVLDVARGSARFSFAAGTSFSVRANDTLITAGDARTPGGGPFEGEVQARADGGGLICELAQSLKVRGAGAASATPAALSAEAVSSAGASVPGRVIELGPDGTVKAMPIPLAAMPASLSAGATPAAALLCQCEALKERVEDVLATQQALAEEAAETAPAEDVASTETALSEPVSETTPAEEIAGQQPEQSTDGDSPSAPPVAPPEAPPVALAEPSPPDPFDPNVLPPPAAGEPESPVVFVAPPAVPTSGSGGGGIASPS